MMKRDFISGLVLIVGLLLTACTSADVIIQAFKTQAPEYITCIISKETQAVKGSFFQWFYDIDLTIEE